MSERKADDGFGFMAIALVLILFFKVWALEEKVENLEKQLNEKTTSNSSQRYTPEP